MKISKSKRRAPIKTIKKLHDSLQVIRTSSVIVVSTSNSLTPTHTHAPVVDYYLFVKSKSSPFPPSCPPYTDPSTLILKFCMIRSREVTIVVSVP